MAQELKAHCITTRSYNTCFCYDKSEVDAVLAEKNAAIAELKNEINRKEGVGHRWFERCMEARTENVRLKRALYKACANWAKSERYTEATWHGDEHREELWANVQAKCRAKAEEY